MVQKRSSGYFVDEVVCFPFRSSTEGSGAIGCFLTLSSILALVRPVNRASKLLLFMSCLISGGLYAA